MSIIKSSIALLLILCLALSGCAKQERRKKKKVAEGSDLLAGSWVVDSLIYNNREYKISEVEGLASLYEGIYLSFSEDGTLTYINVYIYEGTYEAKGEDAFTIQLTKRKNVDIDDGEVTKEDVESYYIATVLEDGRLRMVEMDEVTGAEKTDDMPKIFSKQ